MSHLNIAFHRYASIG